MQIVHLHDGTKSGYQRLRQPETENQLGSGHHKLRGQSLEETSKTLMLDHIADDSHA